MRYLRCVSLVLVGLAVLLMTADPALAAKRMYKARIAGTGRVLGSAVLGTSVSGSNMEFQLYVRNTAGAVSEVWIVDTETGDSLALCGIPGAAEAVCSHDGLGNLDLSGVLTSGVLAYFGWRGGPFRVALESNRAEVQIFTPAGMIAAGVFRRIFP